MHGCSLGFEKLKNLSCLLSQTEVIAAFQIQKVTTISFGAQDIHEIQMFANLQCLVILSEFGQYGLQRATEASVGVLTSKKPGSP